MIVDRQGNALIAKDDQFNVDDLRNALNFFGTDTTPFRESISGSELIEILRKYATKNVHPQQAAQPVSRDTPKEKPLFKRVVDSLNEGKTETCPACGLKYDPRKVMIIMGTKYCPICQTEIH